MEAHLARLLPALVTDFEALGHPAFVPRNLLLIAILLVASSCLLVVDVGGRGSAATDAGSTDGGAVIGAACTAGDDQFCNADERISTLGGQCVNGRCQCLTPFVFDRNGRCIPFVCTVGENQTCTGACTLGRDETCNDAVGLSTLLGTCTSAGCSCGANSELNELSGKCRVRPRDCFVAGQPPCDGACVVTEGRNVCANNGACEYNPGLRVTQQPSSVKALQIGSAFTITWQVENQMNAPQSYRMALDFTSVVGSTAGAWKSLSTIDSPMVTFGSESLREVTATIRVPVGAVSARLSLRGEGPLGIIRGTSVPIELEVGRVPELSDSRSMILAPAPGGIGPFAPDGGVNPLDAVLLDVGTGCLSGYRIAFNQAGAVPMTLVVLDGAGDYFTSAAFEPGAGAFVIDAVAGAENLDVRAFEQRAVTVHFRHVGASLTPTVALITVRSEHRPHGSSTTDFVSYTRFPVQMSPP